MKSLKRILLHEMVAEEIKRFIKENGLKEGDRLPSVQQLSAQFGVSRSSLREGLRFLEANDIIEVKNGKGIYVKDANHFRIEARIKVENEKKFLLQLCAVRRALEGMAVELAAENASDEQIILMEHYLNEYERLRDLGRDTSQADLAFHKIIYEASNNPVLESVIASIWDTFVQFWMKPFGIETIFDDTFPFHRSLLQAIKQRNKRLARKEFDKLMNKVEEIIKKINP